MLLSIGYFAAGNFADTEGKFRFPRSRDDRVISFVFAKIQTDTLPRLEFKRLRETQSDLK